MGLGMVAFGSGTGGEAGAGAGVVFIPLMEPLVEPLMEAASSRSEDEDLGATRVDARRTAVPTRDHLDLAGELMID